MCVCVMVHTEYAFAYETDYYHLIYIRVHVACIKKTFGERLD